MTHEGVVGVAGAGAWGTALANAAAAAGREVVIWGRGEERMRAFEATRLNDRLPGVRLAPAARATADLGELESCAVILVATPAQTTRDAARVLAHLPGAAPVVSCAKGIERGAAFMSEVRGRRRRTGSRSSPDHPSPRTSARGCRRR